MKGIKVLVLILLAMFAAGCCTQKEAVKNDNPGKEMLFPVPEVDEVLPVTFEDDVMVMGTEVNGSNKTDTVIMVKYFPLLKKFFVKAKPDRIKVKAPADTVEVKVTESYPFMMKLGLMFIGLAFGLLIFIVIKVIK